MPKAQATEIVTRAARVTPSSVNEERRTVQIVWTTGSRVKRGFYDPYFEELSLDPKHVRMGRLNDGAPLLDSHQRAGTKSVIGVVEKASLEKSQGIATVRFARGEVADDVFQKVKDGILRNVSVGYQVHKLEKTDERDELDDTIPVYRATDWEPMEISVVPIGADASAQFREEEPTTMTTRTAPITTPASTPSEEIAAERRRCSIIQRTVETLGLGADFAARHVDAGTSEDVFRAAAMTEYERNKEPVVAVDSRVDIAGGTRNVDRHKISMMTEALASRFGGPPPCEEARQYSRLTTVDFAQHCLEARGVNTRMMSRGRIVERALVGLHSTSDFAELLAGTGNRILRRAYDSYQGGLRRACREVEARDFRPIQKLQLSEAGQLAKVNEGGEFTRSTMSESKESYSIATYGRIFGLTRQALINDDLGAFGEMNQKLGRGAAEFVANELVTLLTSNPTMADAVALFHANHSNLDGTGAAISVASLGAALQAMRRQKGLDGVTSIDVTPRYLMVPAALETVGRQVLTSIAAATVADVNPYHDQMELIVDPRLDDDSEISWYVAADPSVIDTIEYAFLEGTGGPDLSMREGFDVDGVEFKVRVDYGAGVIDYRGLYKNVGA